MKGLVFSTMFLAGLISAAVAQEVKLKEEIWRRAVPKAKFIEKDSAFRLKDDSLLKRYQTVPVDIPNAYGKRQGGSSNSPMPIVKLSGKGLAPMPGTEKLDEKEVEKRVKKK